MNSLYYQQNTLEPIFEEETSAFYRKSIDKVELHMDKNSNHINCHFAKKESKTEIKSILLEEIPLKPPDASPMGFGVFGLLKRAFGKRHPKALCRL
ncbi:hypothetical protein TNCV_4248281 [Trichonephila clavipes]|nr:hypothetical protein TNCV_4248281 [Trichonephila clavipes]